MRTLLHFVLVIAALTAAILLAYPVQGQTGAKRLILKDGSYQLATKWEVNGDRVRYYSAERFEWEEVPNSMVDWDATKKWEEERKTGGEREAQQITAEDEAERKAEEARTPTVAPGLKLPDQGGVWMLDDFKGQPQLAEMMQNGGEINKQMGRNIIRATLNPFAGSKQSIELRGTKARIQAHVARPVLYVSIESPDQPADTGAATSSPPPPETERYRIVRAETKSDHRVVGNLKIGLTGKLSQQESFIPATVTSIGGGWYKVVPDEPLKPGEYALVEMLGPKEINLYVWDFGFDPSAPANPGVWKPAPAPSTATGTNESPVLGKRDH